MPVGKRVIQIFLLSSKKLSVTNVFNGPQDFLVSEKLLSPTADDMLKYYRQNSKSLSQLSINCPEVNPT